jgi:BON domain
MREKQLLPKRCKGHCMNACEPTRSLQTYGDNFRRWVHWASVAVALAIAAPALAESERTYQLDPFAQATAGYVGCPEALPPTLTEQEMRVQAHERAERGTSCCLGGTCECGGAYRRDPEINARVVTAIAKDPRFRDSSVWVTTMRKFVTLQGCVRSARQKQWLEQLVKRQADVSIVWNETLVGTAPRKR